MKFELFEPASLPEAIALLVKYGDRAKLLAGGTDLVVNMRERRASPDYIVALGRIPGLDGIVQETGGVRIGALAAIAALEKSAVLKARYTAAAQAASQMASPGIRNMATVGGSLCSATPSGDMAPALLALDAGVSIQGPGGKRELPLAEFFTGPNRTVLGTGEILVSIFLPEPQPHTGSAYFKYAPRGNTDLAWVGTGAALALEGGVCRSVRLALGAVAPTPMRAPRAEASLLGKRIGEAEIEQAAETAAGEARPREGSKRASAEYRRSMVAVFMRRALQTAIDRCGGAA